MKTTDRSMIEAKKRKEFLKIRTKLELDNRGIEWFDEKELKSLLDLEIITKKDYLSELQKRKKNQVKFPELKIDEVDCS